MRILSIIVLMLLNGCTSSVNYSDTPMQVQDANTEFSISERANGFSLAIIYSQYQFIPNQDIVSEACRSQLTSLAYEIAEKRGHSIRVINEQRIRFSVARNGFTGSTTCSATVVAEYAE